MADISVPEVVWVCCEEGMVSRCRGTRMRFSYLCWHQQQLLPRSRRSTKAFGTKTSLAQLAAVAEALTGLAEPSVQLLLCHWQQRKSSLLRFRAEGKVRKGRGRHAAAKAPACAFPELRGKNFKGLDYLEDWACAYSKKLF